MLVTINNANIPLNKLIFALKQVFVQFKKIMEFTHSESVVNYFSTCPQTKWFYQFCQIQNNVPRCIYYKFLKISPIYDPIYSCVDKNSRFAGVRLQTQPADKFKMYRVCSLSRRLRRDLPDDGCSKSIKNVANECFCKLKPVPL